MKAGPIIGAALTLAAGQSLAEPDNRDFVWNRQIKGAKFRRIDGGEPDKRRAATPGVLWMALARHDPTLRQVFESNHDPAGWGGLSSTPRWLASKLATP